MRSRSEWRGSGADDQEGVDGEALVLPIVHERMERIPMMHLIMQEWMQRLWSR